MYHARLKNQNLLKKNLPNHRLHPCDHDYTLPAGLVTLSLSVSSLPRPDVVETRTLTPLDSRTRRRGTSTRTVAEGGVASPGNMLPFL